MDNNSEEVKSAIETDDEKATSTPVAFIEGQKIMDGRVTKRTSPRKGKKTNYKKLDDPFLTMDNTHDEDGNNIFGEPSGTESEDTYATDGSFKENDAAVKMEEAV